MSRPLALGLAALLAYAFTRLSLGPLLRLVAAAGLVRPSRRGGTAPTAAGVVFPLALAVSAGWLVAAGALDPGRLAAGVTACAGLGVLGLLDDVLGRDGPRGWRGHWRSLLQGRPSMGALKALAGGALALAAGAAGAGPRPGWDALLDVLLDGVLVALSGNAFNLLDTAPGWSALAWLGAALPVALAAPQARGLLLPLAAALAAYLPLDLGARAMMGDAGAYALGGGLGAALAIAPRPARLLALALLLAFNLALDRWSLSAFLRRCRGAGAQRRP